MGVTCSGCSASSQEVCRYPEKLLCGHKSAGVSETFIVQDPKEEVVDPTISEHVPAVASRCISKEWATANASNVVWTEAATANLSRPMAEVSANNDNGALAPMDHGNGPMGEDPNEPSSPGGRPRWQAVIRSVQWAGMQAFTSGPSPQDAGAQETRPCGNTNRPQDYAWMKSVLQALARNEATTLGCTDSATGRAFTPIFFMIGACPNYLCGMQAVVYCVCPEGQVDFWWVKPSKTTPSDLEEATLHRNGKGPHKNDPGRSRQFYKPLADLFEGGESKQGWRFGIERVLSNKGAEAPRAYLQLEAKDSRRLYVHLFWQEDWTMNPLARSKYIKGKLVYQKLVSACQYFSRQYEIHDGVITISEFEEKPFTDVLLGDEVKKLWALDGNGGIAH